MITVPEAAKRVGRNPETIRRWIREGKLRARKIGTQHVLEEADLAAAVSLFEHTVELPPEWQRTFWGGPMPDVVGAIRRSRSRRWSVRVVVDASVIVQVCLAGSNLGPLARHELVAPPLLASEVTSTISELAFRSEVPRPEARQAAMAVMSLPIAYERPTELGERAWDLAQTLGWAKTYDAEYLALAQILDVPLVTIDERLRRAAGRLVAVPAVTDLWATIRRNGDHVW